MSQSLARLRRKLGQEVGQFGTFTASGGGASTIICGEAFASSVLPTTANAYAWVYVPSSTAPKQRRVTLAGLNGATATLTVDGAFGSAVGAGTVFEVSSRLPCISESSDAHGASNWLGLNQCLNLALRHILVPDTLSLPLVTGQYDYDTSTWPWLDRESRLLEIRELNAIGARQASTWRKWSFQTDVPSPSIRFEAPYVFASGSYSDDLIVMRPCDTLIKVAGTWGDSTVGLVNETDECGSDENAIVTVARYYVYRAIRDSIRGPAQTRYADLAQQQLALAMAVRNFDTSNMVAGAPAGAAVPAGPPQGAQAQQQQPQAVDASGRPIG